jgi:hypothetical protein
VVNPNDPDQFEVGDTVLNFDARNEILTYLDGEPMVSDGLRCVCLMLMFRVGTGVSVRR